MRRRGLGAEGDPVSTVADKTWFGQPRGLTILFLTNMWELFSYYGMRTLLVYYMTKQLLFAQEKASLIYGSYTAMAYFTPILGGMVADRWLGKTRNACKQWFGCYLGDSVNWPNGRATLTRCCNCSICSLNAIWSKRRPTAGCGLQFCSAMVSTWRRPAIRRRSTVATRPAWCGC